MDLYSVNLVLYGLVMFLLGKAFSDAVWRKRVQAAFGTKVTKNVKPPTSDDTD
jgi:hypothetical protein